jgi:RNA polymerase sigma-70 factor (ECF subfamily)
MGDGDPRTWPGHVETQSGRERSERIWLDDGPRPVGESWRCHEDRIMSVLVPTQVAALDVVPETRVLDTERLGDHVDRLYRAARALTGCPHQAEDLVQDMYLKLLRRPRDVHGDDDLRYLLIALRNTFLTSRTDRRMPTPEEALTRDVLDCVSELPPKLRDVIIAVDVVGLSYREAADVIGLPLGTVMSRLYRARARVVEAHEA